MNTLIIHEINFKYCYNRETSFSIRAFHRLPDSRQSNCLLKPLLIMLCFHLYGKKLMTFKKKTHPHTIFLIKKNCATLESLFFVMYHFDRTSKAKKGKQKKETWIVLLWFVHFHIHSTNIKEGSILLEGLIYLFYVGSQVPPTWSTSFNNLLLSEWVPFYRRGNNTLQGHYWEAHN